MTVAKPSSRAPSESWHALAPEAVLERIRSTPEGLSEQEAQQRLAQHGPNILKRESQNSPWKVLFRQINNPLIWVLLGSAALAIGLGKVTDGLVVLAVVVLNTLIGFIQEFRAGQAIEALARMVPETVTALRGGTKISLSAEKLVPGDVVELASGDKVPADMRLISARNLQVEEAALTGESVPVRKQLPAVAENASLGDRTNLTFGGTLVTSGAARAVVVATGDTTELGRISRMLGEATDMQTPMTKALATIGRYLTGAILAMSVVLLGVGLVRGYALSEALLVAITLAVAAIPEGLPAIVTIALAIGVQRMAARQAVIRKLPAVETLGSTTVICSDKTGTLTRNEMTVQALWTPEGSWSVSGVGYAIEGEFQSEGKPAGELPPSALELLRAGVLCNDAALQTEGKGSITGDPTEGALLVAAEKAGVRVKEIRDRCGRVDAIPFESEHQFMATLNEDGEGQRAIILKGAPEVVLKRCQQDGASTDAVFQEMDRLASQGMRVLAMARKAVPASHAGLKSEDVEGGFALLGLQGMIDPPRQEVIAAVRACHEAGIVVKMITGDHQKTAESIGRKLGLPEGEVVTGQRLAELDDTQLQEVAASTNVFARVAPEHKLRLVRALQARHQVVAMTGDGVNDAPALKQANIGVAMGITGTAVSKESADIVLTDDNFTTIVSAVEEGRRVYDNLVKSLAFVLPTNLGLALILAFSVAFFPIQEVAGGVLAPLMPMLPVQFLWINLVATVALALPLAFEAKEPHLMRRSPRAPTEPVLSRFVMIRTAVAAVVMAAGAIGLFSWELNAGTDREGSEGALRQAQTMAVTTVILFQIFYLLMCRSLHGSLFKLGLFSNPMVFLGIGALVLLQLGFIYLPFMQKIFGTAALGWKDLGISALAAAVILPVISAEKAWRRRRTGGSTPAHASAG